MKVCLVAIVMADLNEVQVCLVMCHDEDDTSSSKKNLKKQVNKLMKRSVQRERLHLCFDVRNMISTIIVSKRVIYCPAQDIFFVLFGLCSS